MKKLIVIALILSITTGFAFFRYMSTLEKDLVTQTVPVVVAANQIPKHTLISPEMVTIQNLPPEAVHQLSLRSIDDVVGLVTRENMEASEQILKAKLGDLEEKDGGLSYSIKEGYRALTIKTDEVIGVADRIAIGDRVDIVAIMETGTGNDKKTNSMMIAENIEILEIGMRQISVEASTNQTSVTVSVLTEELLKINYALSEGKYRLVLRSVIDNKIVNPPVYSME